MLFTRPLDRLLPQGDAAARLLDLFARGSADLINLDRQSVFEFAVAQELEPGAVATDQLRLTKELLVNHGALLEGGQVAQIDHRIILVERGVVEATLRQTPNQRHLPAFKPEPNAAARARLLALVAFAA